MELNWTTFILEIVNFLVLVWLLKHFLYVPVKKVVERRRAGIEEQIDKAKQIQEEADALRSQYENRLDDWEEERQEARQRLQRELDAERKRLFDELQEDLAAERKKNEVLAEREIAEHRRECEIHALEMGGEFVSRLLEGVASAEVEQRLIDLLLDELKVLPPAERDALQEKERGDRKLKVAVVSAYPLDDKYKTRLRERFENLLTGPLEIEWHEDRKLIAGVRITVGPWVIHANLNDELKAFTAITHEH